MRSSRVRLLANRYSFRVVAQTARQLVAVIKQTTQRGEICLVGNCLHKWRLEIVVPLSNRVLRPTLVWCWYFNRAELGALNNPTSPRSLRRRLLLVRLVVLAFRSSPCRT